MGKIIYGKSFRKKSTAKRFATKLRNSKRGQYSEVSNVRLRKKNKGYEVEFRG